MIKVYVEKLKTQNCSGRDYPRIIIEKNGEIVSSGRKCACWGGCSNTMSRDEIEEYYGRIDDIIDLEYEDFEKIDQIHYQKMLRTLKYPGEDAKIGVETRLDIPLTLWCSYCRAEVVKYVDTTFLDDKITFEIIHDVVCPHCGSSTLYIPSDEELNRVAEAKDKPKTENLDDVSGLIPESYNHDFDL